jgi:hypothetical protein
MIAVLFARQDSIYKSIPGCDVYDRERDARSYAGQSPIVAHPPCRAWGTLRHLARPAAGERELAPWALRQIRVWGGVLEHPKRSQLWPEWELPPPGRFDTWGGFTFGIYQSDFGHRAEKATLLYICGLRSIGDLPAIPLRLGRAERVIAHAGRDVDGYRPRKGDPGWRSECTHTEREATPEPLARWLVEVAARCRL